MEFGSPRRGALENVRLVAACQTTRKKKDRDFFFTGEGIFPIRILFPLRKEKKFPPRPSNNLLTTAYSQ